MTIDPWDSEPGQTHSVGDDCPGGHVDSDEILALLLESIAADDEVVEWLQMLARCEWER